MRSNNLLGGNPLTQSVFNQIYDEILVAPGPSEFITTENSLRITTEDGIFLVT